MNLGDIGSIASIVSLPATAVSVVAALRSPGMARSLMLIIAVPIAIAAYTIDVFDRLGWIKLSETGDVIQGWGRHDGALFITVNSRLLLGYQNKFKMVLIIELPYTDIDKMTDTHIEKTALFSITGNVTTMSVVPSIGHLRVVPPPDAKVGDIFDRLVGFSLVLLPNNLSAEQVESLLDVQKLGGQIIATYSTNVQFQVGEKPAD
jgi:hypothetical protein